ncbi:MAG: DsrE family protein [Planctomycetota bacterium]
MNFKANWIIVVLLLVIIVLAGQVFVRAQDQGEKNKLGVLWTSGDADVAHKVCFMYTHNAKEAGWFDEVTLIIWGPSSRLLAGDKELEAKVKEMMASGVDVKACKACADLYGVSEKIGEMGIEVKYMGEPLSEMLKGDWKVLTF